MPASNPPATMSLRLLSIVISSVISGYLINACEDLIHTSRSYVVSHRVPCWEDAVLAAFISSPPLPSSWKELYLVLGSSSAGLIGLLFVATSLHLAEIANEEIYRLRAQYTMLVLLSTLVASIGVLMPQPITILGLELLAVSLWGL